ncbi:MAG: hypothetical protein IJC70_02055 [Firmicutes bacterium]|nr:hypothetical protein [Bacillota bacterium]
MNRKLLVIVFLAGLLLVGLGCGVAFAQYSQFEYVGERQIGAEELTQVTLTEQLQHDGDILINTWASLEKAVQADASVAKDVICVDVAYNDQWVTLYGLQKGHWNAEDCDDFWLGWGDEAGNELNMLFAVRDAVLADLKEHQIGSYNVTDIDKIVVRVHPDNVERVKFY